MSLLLLYARPPCGMTSGAAAASAAAPLTSAKNGTSKLSAKYAARPPGV